MENDAPLGGLRIAAFTQFLLGPAACQYLSDLGAEVIKVEPTGTGAFERTWAGANSFVNGESVFFLSTHRNVKSVAINLKDSAGRDAALRLIGSSDVVVENFRPGAMERLGLGYADARKVKPTIIYASASGYGADGPGRDLPGQDLLLQALSGLASITGTNSQPPTPSGAAVVDQHAASLLALAITAAVLHRERTGEGRRVQITMLEAALDLQLEPLTYFLNGARIERPERAVASAFHPAPYGIYATADGHIALSLSPLSAVAEALGGAAGLDEQLSAADLVAVRDEVQKIVQGHLLAETTTVWLGRLRACGVWCAPVNTYEQMLGDPIVRHADPFIEVEHPTAGSVRLLRGPLGSPARGTGSVGPPPALGQHTDEVLRSIGLTSSEVESLRRSGAVA